MGARETIEPGFRRIYAGIQHNVELIPDDRLDVRPEGLETRSFREIALHIADSCVLFSDNIGKTSWERITAFPSDAYRTKAQVVDAVRQGGERYLTGLARLTDAEAARVCEAPWGGRHPQGMLVGFQVPHLFYHNGQLAIYLRMAGIKPLFAPR